MRKLSLLCAVHTIFSIRILLCEGNFGMFRINPTDFQKRLKGNVFKDFRNFSSRKCLDECVRRPFCRSFNYNNVQLHCELNEAAGNSDFVDDAQYFYKVERFENYTDFLCKHNPCKKGYKCVTFSNGQGLCIFDIIYYDCSKHQKQNGIYHINPKNSAGLDVYCEMETHGGGWTVIQNRFDGSVNFERSCEEYENGFGNLETEFWLGNNRIHQITNQGDYELIIELENFAGEIRYARYGTFHISNESDDYRLKIGNFSGEVGDSMEHHNNRQFSCPGRDKDSSNIECSKNKHGSWWYGTCVRANLNGQYKPLQLQFSSDLMSWKDWEKGLHVQLKRTKMMIRRN